MAKISFSLNSNSILLLNQARNLASSFSLPPSTWFLQKSVTSTSKIYPGFDLFSPFLLPTICSLTPCSLTWIVAIVSQLVSCFFPCPSLNLFSTQWPKWTCWNISQIMLPSLLRIPPMTSHFTQSKSLWTIKPYTGLPIASLPHLSLPIPPFPPLQPHWLPCYSPNTLSTLLIQSLKGERQKYKA